MACFIVPAVEAVITTMATKAVKSKEKEAEKLEVSIDTSDIHTVEKIPFSRKLGWLNNLLWGGSGLLAFEHVWHGEVVPWFPFLTAAGNPTDAAEMLHEMSTVGVGMACLVTMAWLGMVAVSYVIEKRTTDEQKDDTLEEV
ncbi:MAG: hypothetical protein IJV15_01090 [Lachnospiraceae bacterium]|nr:hypothetical protein [Lachnospiraceae bacterium]